MTKIIEKKMVEQETISYIADDGKSFTSEVQCMAYENNDLKTKFDLIEHRRVELPFLCEGFGYICKFESTRDVAITRAYLIKCCGYSYTEDYVRDEDFDFSKGPVYALIVREESCIWQCKDISNVIKECEELIRFKDKFEAKNEDKK